MKNWDDNRYRALLRRFIAEFGEGIPLMMIPDAETLDSLAANCEKCFAAHENLLPEIYDMRTDGSRLY